MPEKFTCGICLKENDKKDLTSFGCKHEICKNCMETHIENLFLNYKKSFLIISCPVVKKTKKKSIVCGQLLSHDDFKKYSNTKTQSYYNEIIKTIPKNGKTLKDFNYYFNNKGELRNIDNGKFFKVKIY
jgi:hypothetical protein